MSTPNAAPSAPVGKHAVVYGGSMAGLTTAGVLSRHFERVTLVERDPFPDGPHARKGVPQAHHIHGLMVRGMNILSDVFPGFREALTAAGGRFVDVLEAAATYKGGNWRPRFKSGIHTPAQSRLLLEWVVHQRLQAIPNVHIRDGREAVGVVTSEDKTRVTGLRIQAPGGGQEETLEADLVVDATGRGSRMPQWMEALGYPRVEETHITVNVGYAGRLYKRPKDFAPGWDMLGLIPNLPKERRMGLIQPIEGDRWLVTMGGWLGDVPAPDDASFLEFARGLPQPHLYQAIKNAEPLGPIHVHRFPHNQRRHYERMARFPEGLALVGDAVCSFNPIYGQGMTAGAMQAEALGQSLRQGLRGATERYRRGLDKVLQVPWGLAISGDLAIPEVEGKRPRSSGLMKWYGHRFQQLASYDPEAMLTVARVQYMIAPPSAMFSPRMVLKVLTLEPEKATRTPGPLPLAIGETPEQAASASKTQAA